MRNFRQRWLQLTLLCAVSMFAMQLQADCCCECTYDCDSELSCPKDRVDGCEKCHTVFVPRSQNSNSAYFWLPYHKLGCDTKEQGIQAIIAEVGIEYQKSFKDCDLAKCLFGARTLHFQGSHVPNRDPNALIADNFGLSHLFDGTIKFKPRIQNINFHFQSHFDLNCACDGLYAGLNFTFAQQTRNLFGKNCVCDPITTGTSGQIPFPQGYMASGTKTIFGTGGLPSGTVADGQVFPASGLRQALEGDFTFGDMKDPWRFGRFVFGPQKLNAMAGFDLILGYHFWNSDCGHFDAFFQYVAPTGNRPNARFVFAPIVGNGHHHEVGGGIDAHWQLWKTDCGTWNLYINGNVTTLLPDCQVRSFDFKNKGCLSRYMLLKELSPIDPVVLPFSARPDFPSGSTFSTTPDVLEYPATFAYSGSTINAINFATRFAKVKVDVRGDASIRLVYEKECLDFGFGYNVYGQTREKLCIIPGASPCSAIDPNKHYGFKGCTGNYVYTYNASGTPTVINDTNIALRLGNSTASNATITDCGDIDNPLLLTGPGVTGSFVTVDWTNGINGFQAGQVPTGTLVSTLAIASSSNPLVEVRPDALDVNSGRAPRQLTHKGFFTVTHNWSACDWKPYVGFGVEVEGGTRHCDLKQWGVWFKAGASF